MGTTWDENHLTMQLCCRKLKKKSDISMSLLLLFNFEEYMETLTSQEFASAYTILRKRN